MTETAQAEAVPRKKGAEGRIKELIAERYQAREQCEALIAENNRLRSELREFHYREQLRKTFQKGRLNGTDKHSY